MPKTFLIKDGCHLMEFSEADNLELGDLYIINLSNHSQRISNVRDCGIITETIIKYEN